MIQCSECQYYQVDAVGNARFTCNPFTTIVEPECLQKWELIKLDGLEKKMDTMVKAYQATVSFYQRIAPLQEKMFRHMEREIDDIDEADSWKTGYEDEEEDEDFGSSSGPDL